MSKDKPLMDKIKAVETGIGVILAVIAVGYLILFHPLMASLVIAFLVVILALCMLIVYILKRLDNIYL